MKKALIIVLLCLSLSAAAYSMSFSLKLTGGPNFLFGGDYNKIAEDANHPMYGPLPMATAGEIKKLSLGWNFAAEFIVNFGDNMGLGLGVGYITASDDSSLTASIGPLSESYNYQPSVSVIPIVLSFHYSLPISSAFTVQFSAGPGLYISSFDFSNHYVFPLALTDLTETFDPNSKVFFGGQAGLGLEFAVSPSVSLTLDVLGRLANLSDFAGTHTLSGTLFGLTGNVTANNHMFYYFEEDGQAHYAIQANLPSGAGVISARAASISLSGLCTMIGVKINL
jgi:opacity protein-like surface antigen